MNPSTISYKNHRFPPQIIAHAVWLYFRFPLSLRLVEEMLLERGIIVSYETIRRWSCKFGAAYSKHLRRKKPSREDIWYAEEARPHAETDHHRQAALIWSGKAGCDVLSSIVRIEA
jgi:putative transposase